MIKTFKEFLKLYESGNAIDDVRPILGREIPETLEHVERDLLNAVGLDGFDIDAAVIGSAGKKGDDIESGDIDIAVSIDKLAGENSTSINEVLKFLNMTLKAAGYDTAVNYGFKQVSVPFPIKGDKANGYCQVDLMLSDSLEWSKFMYHSPDFTKTESRYKGAYRNLLMMAIATESKKEATKKLDTGETVEYEQLVIRLNTGLVKVRKSLQGKRGLVKTPKLLKDFDRVVSNVPDEVAEALFGEGVKAKDIMTFEKCWDLFNSKTFPYKNKEDIIIQKFEIYLSKSKLPFPEEL